MFRRRDKQLQSKIDPDNVPAHVGIIMDGNGRWAKKRAMPRLMGHREGVKAIRSVLEAAAEIGVGYLTLYSFSQENWTRPADEVSGLMDLFEEMLERETPELAKQGVRLLTIGRLDQIRPSTRDRFAESVAATKDNSRISLVLAINYGGRSEIADAAVRMCQGGEVLPESVTERADLLGKYMYRPDIPDPDLIIRTSGELRLSNFLTWQSAYSEYWVTDKLWPDMKKEDFHAAIVDFQQRTRRFGGLS